MHSDSSQWAWAGVNLTSHEVVQEFWRGQNIHINIKELEAAMHTIKSFAKTNDVIKACVDNQVAFAYLNKWGGRLSHFNKRLKPFLMCCLLKKYYFPSGMGPFRPRSGRRPLSHKCRSRRLHHGPKSVFYIFKKIFEITSHPKSTPFRPQGTRSSPNSFHDTPIGRHGG